MVVGNTVPLWLFARTATNKGMRMSSTEGAVVSLKFPLEVEDDWPPVAVESMPFRPVASGYEVQAAPLFVKDLSVGDVIAATLGDERIVEKWRHITRSSRTTIWLLRLKEPSGIDAALTRLRSLGCNSVGLDAAGCYAVDVPESVSMESVDPILEALDSALVAVAFPSMRHPD
jgi:hypothetical protein